MTDPVVLPRSAGAFDATEGRDAIAGKAIDMRGKLCARQVAPGEQA